MLRIPTTAASEIGRINLDLFASSAAAREFEDRADVWTVVEWSWTAGPPMHVVLRGERGERMNVVVDEDGVWRFASEPVESKVHPPSDLPPP